jgi:hypothetical protein
MKTKIRYLFMLRALVVLALTSSLIAPCVSHATLQDQGGAGITPSAATITFDEFPTGTVDPSIVQSASGFGNMTVSFTGTTASDVASDSNPILEGHSGLFGNVSISFSTPVAAVGFKAGSFETANSTTIEAFDANGNSLGNVRNTAPSGGSDPFELFSISDSSGGDVIKSITISITGTEPSGFEIDNVSFQIKTGSLGVTLNPSAAVTAGAQWSLNGGTYQNDGTVLNGLPIGQYTISFKSIPGYITPPDKIAAVTLNGSTGVTGNYAAAGAVQVTINPPAVVSAGAQWEVDNTGVFNNSGTTVNNVVTGTHSITYTSIAGWVAPAIQLVAVNTGITTNISATYFPDVGGLRVTIAPTCAAIAGAQWQVDGGPFQNSGVIVPNLASGNHTISFSPVAGYTTSSNQTVVVSYNSTNSIVANYSYLPIPGTIIWVNAGINQNWSTPTNWNLNRIPASSDIVLIPHVTGTNCVLDVNATVAGLHIGDCAAGGSDGLNFNAHTLTVTGPIIIQPSATLTLDQFSTLIGANAVLNGVLGWTFGTLGGTFSIAADGTLNINSGGNTHYLPNCIITNNGTVNWSSDSLLGGGASPGTLIYNYGLWNCQDDQQLAPNVAGNGIVFNNFGTFRKSGGASVSFTQLPNGVIFNNSGVVDIQQGNLHLLGGGNFTGGTATANTTGSTVLANGIYTVNGTVTGTNFIQNGASLTNMNVINGGLTWLSGSWGGVVTIASNSVVNIYSGGNSHDLPNCVITNFGTVNWNDDNLLGGGSSPGTLIYNYGLWNVQGDGVLGLNVAGNGMVFNNFGTFRKSGGASVSFTQLPNGVIFNNSGVVDVQQGNLHLLGGGNFTGGYVTTNTTGSTVLANGNYTVNGTVTGSNFVENGGNLIGTNLINSYLTWVAGSWNAVVTINPGAVLAITPNGNNHAFANSIINNYGTVNWNGDTLQGGGSTPGTIIYNYGLWNAQDDQSFQANYGGNGILFDNFGTFRKSGGASISFSQLQGGVVFNNSGVLDVQQGNLHLLGGGTFTGGTATANTTGTTVLATGSYTVNGMVTGTNFILNGATLTNLNVIHGGFTWLSGNWNGVVNIASDGFVNIYGGGNLHYMPNCIITNYGTVNWNGDLLQGGGNSPGTFVYNYGLWNALDDESISANYGGNGFIFNNYGTIRKSATSGGSSQFGITFTNAGTLDMQAGVVSLTGSYNLLGGTLNFNLNKLTNFARLNLANSAALGGPLHVSVGGTFAPTNGSLFQIISSSGQSGVFSNVTLPAGISVNYSNNGVFLLISGAVPVQILAPQLAGSSLSFQFPTASGQSYTVQGNDDLTTTNWIFYTNIIGSGSVFQFQVPVTAAPPHRFFRIREP